MIVFCKKYYPYDQNDPKTIIHQSYFTGRTYNAEKIFHENEIWYHINDEFNNQDLFSPEEFDEYFYDLPKLRKEKLNKIKNYE